MKKLSISLLAVITVAVLSMSAFAANTMDKERMSSDKASNRVVMESQLRGLSVLNQDGQVIGEIQTVNTDAKTGKINSITFKGLTEKHYGLAPSWEDRQGTTSEMRMVNPSLRGVDENFE